MKKSQICVLMVIMALSITACGNTKPTERSGQTSGKAEQEEKSALAEEAERRSETSDSITDKKILVAYFSWAENAEPADMDALTSASVAAPGNVSQLASWVGEQTGGDLFSIQAAEPYPADWDGCLDRANKEKSNGSRPELKQTATDMEDYDIVFIGYPNWWYSCPMIIFSFIEAHDLSGKQIYLFCSHGTGGLAESVDDIKGALPDSDISENVFDAYEDDTADAKTGIETWLNEIGF